MLERAVVKEAAVRFPGRLGRRRPVLERCYEKWPRRTLGCSLPIILLIVGVGVGAVLLSGAGNTGLSGERILGALLYLSAVAGAGFVLGAREDVRCVVAAHERTRIMKGSDRERIAAEVSWRRRRWEEWLGLSHARVNGLQLLRSRVWRGLIFAYVVAALGGEMIKGGKIPVPAALRARIESARELVLFGLLIAVIVSGSLIWRQVAARLRGSLKERKCPDCGYSLEPGEAAMVRGVQVAFGPARCPECGCPWPLVPPPEA